MSKKSDIAAAKALLAAAEAELETAIDEPEAEPEAEKAPEVAPPAADVVDPVEEEPEHVVIDEVVLDKSRHYGITQGDLSTTRVRYSQDGKNFDFNGKHIKG